MWGPYPGPRHDSALLYASGLLDQLNMLHAQGHQYSLYGDSAYPLSAYILKPWLDVGDDLQKARMNKAMSNLRISVEHGFSLVIKNFQSLNCKAKQQSWLIPVGKIFVVATLFTNCQTCYYGNQVSTAMGLSPPTIDFYLQ